MNQLTVEKILKEIDATHRDLAKLSVDQLQGTPSALKTSDILQLHPIPVAENTVAFLRKSLTQADTGEEKSRIERVLFGCTDLVLVQQTASLADMLKFYMERGRMHVGSERIPALEVVNWVQAEPDFGKREEIRKEMNIYLKGIINPILLGMTEVSIKTITEKFGFQDYGNYYEVKKRVSFGEYVPIFEEYLQDTAETYLQLMKPWIAEKIGQPFKNLSRYHALHLVRISRFDHIFPASRLTELALNTFRPLGLDLSSREDIVLDISDDPIKNPDGICVGVEIPGHIFVLMKPVGGLIDVETLLHEMGHAFFLSNFDPELPVEYRRLYRSPAFDETFAFLFMDLLDNQSWLTEKAGMSPADASILINLFRAKRLCLIRRHIGKFLTEKEFYEGGDIKNSLPYCDHLRRATGFVYEPQAYLIDMEPDFYALDYLKAWAAANVLRGFLEKNYGEIWYRRSEAGAFLRKMAISGRRDSVDAVINAFCGKPPILPDFLGD